MQYKYIGCRNPHDAFYYKVESNDHIIELCNFNGDKLIGFFRAKKFNGHKYTTRDENVTEPDALRPFAMAIPKALICENVLKGEPTALKIREMFY